MPKKSGKRRSKVSGFRSSQDVRSSSGSGACYGCGRSLDPFGDAGELADADGVTRHYCMGCFLSALAGRGLPAAE